MNREEAAEFTRKLLARAEINAFPSNLERINNIPAFYFEAVLSALRGPQPDPITGLVPCGCGGKAEYYDHPVEDWVAVECVECGADTSYKDTKEQARGAWNLSHSYREGTAE